MANTLNTIYQGIELSADMKRNAHVKNSLCSQKQPNAKASESILLFRKSVELYHILSIMHDQYHGIHYTVGEQKTFLSSRKILSIVVMWDWLQCC